jgi:hypothetical protein
MNYTENEISKICMMYIFPKQFGLVNVFTNKDIPPNKLYENYIDRNNELRVSIIIFNNYY